MIPIIDQAPILVVNFRILDIINLFDSEFGEIIHPINSTKHKHKTNLTKSTPKSNRF